MRKRCHAAGVLGLSLIVLAVLPLIHSQTFQFKRGQAVYVFAARDSHLFTMNPTKKAVKFPTGKTWKSDGTAKVMYPHLSRPDLFPYEVAVITFGGSDVDPRVPMDFLPPLPGPNLRRSISMFTLVYLPLPAEGAGEGMAAALPIPGSAVLDRVIPDPAIKSKIEAEFLKRMEYVIVDSPEKADLVFLAEGTYLPMRIAEFPAVPNGSGGRSGAGFGHAGDYKAEYLQTLFAIVVPAAAFNPSAIRSTALMEARLWEGSATWQSRRFSIGAGPSNISFPPASPESVVAQFHKKEERPSSHFPLCAASARTLRVAGSTPANRAAAQELKTNAIPPNVSPEPGQKAAGDNQAIRVNVTLVMVPTVVSDQEGKSVSDLKYSNFHVFEDDVEQKIDRIIPEAEPFDAALIVDTSASMRLKAEGIKNAASAFADAVRPEDRLMIVSFDDRIFVHSELAANRLQLSKAISLMGPGDGTRLYDAVDLVLEDRLDAIRGRKAVVLLTDGVDTRSRIASDSDTLEAIEGSNVLVYAVQYDTSKETKLKPIPSGSHWIVLPEDARNNTERYQRADKYLLSLCERSGGDLYIAQAESDLSEVFAGITERLRQQYILCYYRSDSKQDGAYHRIKVEVDRPGVKVRARTGYRASDRGRADQKLKTANR
jgi:Ca-activated chloride channel family protein